MRRQRSPSETDAQVFRSVCRFVRTVGEAEPVEKRTRCVLLSRHAASYREYLLRRARLASRGSAGASNLCWGEGQPAGGSGMVETEFRGSTDALASATDDMVLSLSTH